MLRSVRFGKSSDCVGIYYPSPLMVTGIKINIQVLF